MITCILLKVLLLPPNPPPPPPSRWDARIFYRVICRQFVICIHFLYNWAQRVTNGGKKIIVPSNRAKEIRH